MDYMIRRARPEDVKPALMLALRVFIEFEAPVYAPGATEKFKADCIENETYINNYVTGKHHMFVALDGEKIVGIVCERGNGHISMMFVDRAYHRRGIATTLMTEMVKTLKEQGFNKITINSSPYGLPFYLKFGFKEGSPQLWKDGFLITPLYYEPKELWDIYDENRVKTERTVERGRPMKEDEYHIVVHVWIRNSRGEWLISKRTPNKMFPDMWECTGGSAVTGEESLGAAIREVREELGVVLTPENGRLFTSYRRKHNYFADVWVFNCDCPIENIKYQESETCVAMWADKVKLDEMIKRGEFFGKEYYPYLDELLKK